MCMWKQERREGSFKGKGSVCGEQSTKKKKNPTNNSYSFGIVVNTSHFLRQSAMG